MKNNALILWLVVFMCMVSAAQAQRLAPGDQELPDGGLSGARTGVTTAPDLFKALATDSLPAGSYTVGTTGYFPTLDSAFRRLSGGGILGPVTLLLIDTLFLTTPATSGRFALVGPISGAGPSSRITIRPADNVAVTIRGNADAVLYFLNVSYLTLDGISLQGNTRLKVNALYNGTVSYNDAIDFIGNCDYSIVQNLTAGSNDIYRLPTCGIAFWANSQGASDSCLVSGVSVTSGGMGIFVGGLEPNYPIKPKGNVLSGNHIGSPSDTLISRGFQLEGTEGTVVENNDVDNLKLKLLDSGNNLYLLGINAYFCMNAIIRNNVVHGLRGTAGGALEGILATGNSSQIGQGVKIYNNMVYDLQNKSTTSTGYIGGIGLWGNNNALVAYNTVWLSGTSADPTGSDALFFETGITNATVRNNILVNRCHQTAGGGCTALWVDQYATFSTNYNDLHVDTAFANSYIGYRGVGYRTLGSWQGAGYDQNSVSVMPPFVSAQDLHLTNTATLVADAATPLAGIIADFDGNPRPHAGHSTPDIGADEFDHPPVVSVGEEGDGIPGSLSLAQNYPNPFNPVTNIRYQLPAQSHVMLKVFDVLGREVATLVNGVEEPGYKEVQFNGSNLSSGMYFYRLQAGSFVDVKKLLLLR